MRNTVAILALSVGLFASQVAAKPAIITSDVQTGIILSSNNIDVKQDPYMAGKMALIFIALNDVMTSDLDPGLMIDLPGGGTKNLALLIRDAAGTEASSEEAMALLASNVAASPNILNERMNALFRKIGMRATTINTTRTRQGGPSWGGYTTNRDIARLLSAMILTHGEYARSVLPKADADSGAIKMDSVWLYRDGMCITLAKADQSLRELATVIQGASSEENCRSASDVALRHNDNRIEKASR